MRPAIAFVTTLATVIHFTCGCCLHASHFAADGGCCAGVIAAGRGDGCCEDHDHDHDHDPSGNPADCHESGVTAVPAAAAVAAPGCGCDGCDCAATPVESRAEMRGPAAGCWVGSLLDAIPAGSASASRGDGAGSPGPVQSRLRPPLSERFLV